MRNQKLIKYLFWGWLVIIFILTTIPQASNPDIDLGDGFEIRLDYFAHTGVYCILSVLFILGFYIRGKAIKKYIFPLVLIAIFAVLDEYKQELLPSRTFNPLDLIYNVTGVLIGIPISVLLLKRWSKK